MTTNKHLVLCFKALADETRLEILGMLSEEYLCACHILEEFDITQPTLSYHMKILVDSGIVNSVKDGTWTLYSINPDAIDLVVSQLSKFDTRNKDIERRCI